MAMSRRQRRGSSLDTDEPDRVDSHVGGCLERDEGYG